MNPRFSIPTNENERWEWIKYQLRMRGTNLSRIAASLGINKNAVANTKRIPYSRVEAEIADKIGIDPENIWPDRYTERSKRRYTWKKPPSHRRSIAETA